MIERLSKKCREAEQFQDYFRNKCRICIFQFPMILVNIATTLFLGILFQLCVPCILLNLSFIPLCIYADEHNVDSPVKCYICTC